MENRSGLFSDDKPHINKKIDVLDHGFVRLIDYMGSDISVSRSARVSYDAAWRAGENEKSDEKLIGYLWNHRHTTPFESVTFTFEVKAPIFVFRQWHRHRTWCLSGDTMITFESPGKLKMGTRSARYMKLDDLFRKWQPTVRKSRPERQINALFTRNRIKKMKLRVFDEEKQSFTTGSICDIICSGVKQVFEIVLADGKTLKCSKDHRLLTTDGWQRLEDAVGLKMFNKVAAMSKSAKVMTNGFSEANTPWNKGITGYKNKPYKYKDGAKEKIRFARAGERSNFWKGGMTAERANIGRWTREQARKVHEKFNYTCQDCGERGGRLHAHHAKPVVTHPELAYDFDNLVTLCVKCHHTAHGRNGDKAMCRGRGVVLRAMSSEIVSVRLVGEEKTYDISVAGNNHNFVANGMIVHNSYNELSGRYKELPEEFYVPEAAMIGTQSKDNKQMRVIGDIADHDVLYSGRDQEIEEAKAVMEKAFQCYRDLIMAGWPRELARSVLPVATYSHMFATVNLLNLFKFFTLRSDAHAQHEIRVYADAMRELIRPIVPVCVAAFEKSKG